MKYIEICPTMGEDIKFVLGCSECGSQVDAGDRFCRGCGHPLAPLPRLVRAEDVCKVMTGAVRNGYELSDVRTKKLEKPVALGEAPQR